MISHMTSAARTLLGGWKLALMALIVALMSLGSGHDSVEDSLAASNLTADFNLVAFANGVPIKDGCDTLNNSDFKCTVHPGGTFQVRVFLDNYPTGLVDGPDADAVGGYRLVDLRMDHSPGLTPGALTWVWPDCGSPFDASTPGVVNAFCYTGDLSGSTYGQFSNVTLATVDFTCPMTKGKQTITLSYGYNGDNNFLKGPWDTLLGDENGDPVVEGPPSDTIVVNCDNPLPQDVTGDGFVTGLDFFSVLGQFGTCKPGLVC
jgi:hypothetical protein